MTTSRDNSGFTLVELMVVILVLGILVTLAAFSMRPFLNAQRVRSASYELFSTIVFARSEALKRNTTVTITPAAGGWQDGWTITSGISTLRSQAAQTGVVITSAASSVSYASTGRLLSTSPTFQVDTSDTPTSNVRCISIDLSGLPKTKKETCS